MRSQANVNYRALTEFQLILPTDVRLRKLAQDYKIPPE